MYFLILINPLYALTLKFYKVKEAIDMLTHSQEKSLVDISYKKYKKLRKNNIEDGLATT